VAFRQDDVRPEGFGAVAVIDALRATTTMTAILERGALAVCPVGDLQAAYAMKARDHTLLLGGERHNQPPEGFDGGNSPRDWPSERVRGRRVVFTTTNGTAAVARVRGDRRVVLAALNNAGAVGRYLLQGDQSTLLVASGMQGQVAMEDVLACGAVARHWDAEWQTDAAALAVAAFEYHRANLLAVIARSHHGRGLIDMGLSEDVEAASRLNSSGVVPVLCQDGWLRAAE